MPSLEILGTQFTFSILPLKVLSSGRYARVQIGIKNEYIDYAQINEDILREDLEEWIFSMFRLLAGAYGREYNLTFEKTGLAVDLYPYTENGQEVPRAERRKNDCIMLVRLMLRSSNKKTFLGGTQSFLLHRKEIEDFAVALRKEFDESFAKYVHGRGKHLFVGVSPMGYKGCNYWYLDKSGAVKAGDYVWVRMGRHNTEQVVFVDQVRYFTDDTAPYDPAKVRQVHRIATEEEAKEAGV